MPVSPDGLLIDSKCTGLTKENEGGEQSEWRRAVRRAVNRNQLEKKNFAMPFSLPLPCPSCSLCLSTPLNCSSSLCLYHYPYPCFSFSFVLPCWFACSLSLWLLVTEKKKNFSDACRCYFLSFCLVMLILPCNSLSSKPLECRCTTDTHPSVHKMFPHLF